MAAICSIRSISNHHQTLPSAAYLRRNHVQRLQSLGGHKMVGCKAGSRMPRWRCSELQTDLRIDYIQLIGHLLALLIISR